MRRLAGGRELLDGTLDDEAVLDGNLRDLGRINQRFGGARLSLDAVRALVGPDPGEVRLIDVGTGGADIPMALLRARGPWRGLAITALDSRQEILAAARRITPGIASTPGLALERADGLELPHPDASFDVAHTSLVLHHLEPSEAVALLRELRRVARLGVVVNDLDRSRRSLVGAWLALHALTRNRYTLNDGVLSVRRAYTRREARALLHEAGLRPVREFVGFAGHRWAIAAVPG